MVERILVLGLMSVLLTITGNEDEQKGLGDWRLLREGRAELNSLELSTKARNNDEMHDWVHFAFSASVDWRFDHLARRWFLYMAL